MKNVMTWIEREFPFGGSDRYNPNVKIGRQYLKLQIDNSLRLGWRREDIIIGANFDFDYMGKKNIAIDISNDWSAFATKMPAVVQLMEKLNLNDNLWIHDCDVFQLLPFDFPEEVIDVGYVRHSVPTRNKPQGGVVFVRPSGYDIIKQLAKEITEKKETKEERYMVEYYKREEYVNRRTWLNYTYNLFRQSDFKQKYKWCEKPVKAVHFHPEFTSVWNCFVEGNNHYNVKIVTPEVKELFIKYGLTPKIER